MRLFYGSLSVAGFLLPVLCFGLHFTRRGETAWSELFSVPFATWVNFRIYLGLTDHS